MKPLKTFKVGELHSSKTYIFASVRGDDFEIEGNSALDAYNNLTLREANNGNLWRLGDSHYNRFAVLNRGFTRLDETDVEYSGPVYKVKSEQ